MKTFETLKTGRISLIWGGFPGRASFFGQKQPKSAFERVKSATDKGTSVSDKGTSVSDKGTSVSDKGTSVSDKGTSVSDKGTSVSDKGTSVSDFVRKMVKNRHLAASTCCRRIEPSQPPRHKGTKMKTGFTAPEARQTTAHSVSCGKNVARFASPGRGGRMVVVGTHGCFVVGTLRGGVRTRSALSLPCHLKFRF
jgi:hypothetical protein